MSYREGYLLLPGAWAVAVVIVGLLAWLARRQPDSARWILRAALGLAFVAGAGLAAFSEPLPRQLYEDLRAAYLSAARQVFAEPAGLYREHSHGFVNVPIVALAFVPLTWLRVQLAVWLYTALGVAAVVGAGFGLIRLTRATGERVVWIVLLFLLCGPLYNSLREGNTTHFVLLALVVALVCLERGRDSWGGAVLAACALVKLPLFLLFAPLLARGRQRVVLGGVLTLTALAGLSLLLFGVEPHVAWWNEILRPSAGRPVGAFNVQSLDGLWIRLLTGTEHLRDWRPIADAGSAFAMLRWGSVVGLVTVTLYSGFRAGAPRSPSDLRHEVVLALTLAILLSPISWSHYLLWMLIPLSLIAAGDLPWPASTSARVALALGAVGIAWPVVLVLPEGAVARELWGRVGTSLGVLGCLSWWWGLAHGRIAGASTPSSPEREGEAGSV